MLTRLVPLVSLLTGSLTMLGPHPHRSADCPRITTISTNPGCYDPKRGLTLLASSETSSLQGQPLEWTIYLLADGSVNTITKSTPVLVLKGTQGLVVPDSFLQHGAKLSVLITTPACQSQHRSASLVYSFVSQRMGGSTCRTWQKQTY